MVGYLLVRATPVCWLELQFDMFVLHFHVVLLIKYYENIFCNVALHISKYAANLRPGAATLH